MNYESSHFEGKILPQGGHIVGYTAIIHAYGLSMPYPNQFAIVDPKNKKENTPEYQLFSASYLPEETLYKQIVFAIKYEGINLLFFKKLFEVIQESQIEQWVYDEPSSIFTRKIWFLYEFLMRKPLNLPDADTKIKFSHLIDETIQFASSIAVKSSRHRIKNNLPGNVNFCPIIYKTHKLQTYIEQDLSAKNNKQITNIRKDILLRTSAFLLLKDSKASFTIEGEKPMASRAMRWGKAIGEAGRNELSKDELIRLQQIVIENNKFTEYGYRQQGGFVGEHDRDTFEPLPDHISAKQTDIEKLMNGLFESDKFMQNADFHPVLAAACIAFGFVFIHPFVDGNGRLHRYIIHHVLSKSNFTPQGIIFPISASILQNIFTYRQVLEHYSHGILPFIEWQSTADNNVTIINEPIDLYRYYDATPQAEFLFDSILDTIENIIPQEVKYIIQYDEFKNYIDEAFDMPDKNVAMLVNFLQNNNGKLSEKSREKEFAALNESEANEIEIKYGEIFNDV